jgi:hypothetical protein
MLNNAAFHHRDLCEEIGGFYGDFYIDANNRLVIDNGEQEFVYNDEEELLKDWLPTLREADDEIGDGYWADVIEYIEAEIL